MAKRFSPTNKRQSNFYAPKGRNSHRKHAKDGNVFQYIADHGHDNNYVPEKQAKPTQLPVGSAEKIEVLRKRVEQGMPLWCDEDKEDWDGLDASDFTVKA